LKNDVKERDDESIQQVECCKVSAFAGHAARIEWMRERVLPTRQTRVGMSQTRREKRWVDNKEHVALADWLADFISS